MRAVVFAYHNIGHRCLGELIRQGHEVAAVVTLEDDPNENVWFDSVAELARDHGLRVLTPEDPNQPAFVVQIRELSPHILFSFYYRHMLKQPLLDIPPLGALNLHGSYLPRYRGRCPVNWVLVNGETETGVTLHYMVPKPDAGDIVAQRKVAIEIDDTALTLYGKLTAAAHSLFAETLPLLAAGTAPRSPQDASQATYFGGRRPEDGRFEWSWPSMRIYNLVRAVTHPYPGAFVDTGGRRLFVWRCEPRPPLRSRPDGPGTLVEVAAQGPVVTTGDGELLLTAFQADGSPEIDGRSFADAYQLTVGRPFAL